MRRMEFKMERTGLLEVGDILPVTEGKLPNSYYYTLGRAYAMSANYKYNERLQSREGKVIDVKETEKGYLFVHGKVCNSPEISGNICRA